MKIFILRNNNNLIMAFIKRFYLWGKLFALHNYYYPDRPNRNNLVHFQLPGKYTRDTAIYTAGWTGGGNTIAGVEPITFQDGRIFSPTPWPLSYCAPHKYEKCNSKLMCGLRQKLLSSLQINVKNKEFSLMTTTPWQNTDHENSCLLFA